MIKKPNILFSLTLATIAIVALSFVLSKNKEKYLGDMFWTKKTYAKSTYNLVLMGDSRVYRGISPEIMETNLPNTKILNFAYSNGGLNATMFAAAHSKLNPSENKKIMLLGITANSITEYTQSNEQYYQELNRPREEVWERLYMNPLLYWFSATSPEKLKDLFHPVKQLAYYLSEYHMNGYVESDKYPIDTLEAISSYTKDFNSYKVEEKNIVELLNLVKRYSAERIIVIGFRPPVSEPLKQLEDSLGNYNEATLKIRLIEAGGYWIDINHSHYKTYDGSHLTKESAKRFSEFIAVEIKNIIQQQD